MSYMNEDTIAAISSAIGEGGIGIIRLSGEASLDILDRIFRSGTGKDTKNMNSYTMRYGHILDPISGNEVDEAIVSYMRKPNTYTKEDVVEINCHGGMVAVRRTLEVVLESGARLAEPGEFTKRAFLNGRIDLSQAEAVMDLIRAKTDESLKLALEQSEGKVSRKIKELMDQLIGVLAHIEATVDYPEEDIEDIVAASVIEEATKLTTEIDQLVKESASGRIIREGLNTVIIGKPNVGKSSLLNALIEENKAIVTNIPGTTRDVIEEYISIEGVPVKIIDTAGIRETGDLVEKIGVDKTREYANKADLIIFMLDGSTELEEEDEEIIHMVKDKKAIVVINKLDLPSAVDLDHIRNRIGSKPIIPASINNEKGIDSIKREIVNLVYEGQVSFSSKDLCITNTRHVDILKKANESIRDGIKTLNGSFPLDMASIEFRNAFLKLGEITGDTTNEDIIDRIFSDFCIGK